MQTAARGERSEPSGYARAKAHESRRGRARTVREWRAAPMQGAQDGARTVRGVARPHPPQGASEASRNSIR